MVHHIADKNDMTSQLTAAGDALVVVDFFATWCGPCKVIAPKLEEFANTYSGKIVVLKIDVDECEDLAAEYGINSMPTFLFIRNSEKVEEFSGANADKLEATIKRLLNAV